MLIMRLTSVFVFSPQIKIIISLIPEALPHMASGCKTAGIALNTV